MERRYVFIRCALRTFIFLYISSTVLYHFFPITCYFLLLTQILNTFHFLQFAEFIMNLDERERWDSQIADVDNIYPIFDTAAANLAQGGEL